MRFNLITLIFVVMILSTNCSVNIDNDILTRIETYNAPPYPKNKYVKKEIYDYRLENKSPVPPTLTDVLICDIWDRIVFDLNENKLSFNSVQEENINKALLIYKDKSFNHIAGYRPYTHSYFINSLNELELKVLSKNILNYIRKHGVKNPEKN